LWLLVPAARPLEKECVEPQAPAAGLRRSDRDLHLELVVAELLDAVAAVDQRPSGAFVALWFQLALPLAMTMQVGSN
jgi:hypothetical protein